MEKLDLARNVCKTVYGLRYRTIDQRLRSTTEEFLALTDEFSKATDPNLKNTVLSPKEAKHVREVTQYFDKSHTELVEHYKHFKEHEEPNLMRCNMFRTYVAPSVAATLVGAFLGEVAYRRHLKKKCQALERELSAETAK